MKYLRIKTGNFYIFPLSINHAAFARENYIRREDIASAGFIYGGKCRDKSVSLGLEAGPTDTADLREQMGMEAIL